MDGQKRIVEIEVDDAGTLWTLSRISANHGAICYVRKPMTNQEADALAPALQFLAKKMNYSGRSSFSARKTRSRAGVMLNCMGVVLAVTGIVMGMQ